MMIQQLVCVLCVATWVVVYPVPVARTENEAVTLLALLIVTEQAFTPVQAPDHDPNPYPDAGVAVRATATPWS